MSSDVQRRLTGWIQRQLPEAVNLRPSPLAAASSGTSNETRLFTLNHDGADGPSSQRLVLRTIAPGRGLFPDLRYRVRKNLYSSAQVRQIAW